MGSEMPERGTKTSTVPVVWAILEVFRARFKWFPVEICGHGRNLVISPWPGDKQQSSEWRYSDSPRPKKFRVQKSAGNVPASIFFRSRRHPHHWLSSKGPNYQRWVLLTSDGAIKWHFEGKTPREVHQWCLFLVQFRGSTGISKPGLTMSWSPSFVRRGAHCCRRDLVGRTNFRFFFEWLIKT